jgi:cytochrome P450
LRLRDEIAEIAGLGLNATQPSREQLKKMKYLEVVIKESMRLYPPVPVNARTAVRTTTLPVGGGLDGQSPILIRKGEVVSYSPYVMHRREDIYGPDASEYKPERWENDALKHVGYGYLPFNAGPRNCLGQSFALLEMTYTIARLIQRFPSIDGPFDQTVSDVGKEKQILTLVLLCEEGCRVRLQGAGSVEDVQSS